MVRLTDRPDMTLDVYRGRKTTTQQLFFVLVNLFALHQNSVERYTCIHGPVAPRGQML